jgi:hypothetical protein
MLTRPQELVLKALRGGVRTWAELKEQTKLNDERLGSTLSELFDLRKIWTLDKGDSRIYGIERRTDRVPRFPHPHMRSTDRPQ